MLTGLDASDPADWPAVVERICKEFQRPVPGPALAQNLTKAPIEVFYSYSHKDEKLRDKLETHLSQLQHEGLIAGWHDRKISAGTEWKGQIDEHLRNAQIILLLVSPDFLAAQTTAATDTILAIDLGKYKNTIKKVTGSGR
jgi:hypothetical protein